nr:phage tail sheath C-terminal domain-containing protein [Dysosmobacter welbionis]
MVADDETQALKKIKMVAAVDLIRYYALTTIEDNYQGKCSNTYDNKCILLTALRGYLKELENGDVLLEKSSGAELDAAAIRAFLIDQASKAGDVEEANRIKALDDAAVVKEDTGSHVFIRLFGYVLDAMEDFAVVLEVSNGLLAM